MALHIYQTTYDKYIKINPEDIDPVGLYFLDNGMIYMQNKMYGVEFYVHEQILASSEWVINHPLKKYPVVNIMDTGGNVVSGDINYVSDSQIIIVFTSEFSGKAILN